jgi:hypothetical protein
MQEEVTRAVEIAESLLERNVAEEICAFADAELA